GAALPPRRGRRPHRFPRHPRIRPVAHAGFRSAGRFHRIPALPRQLPLPRLQTRARSRVPAPAGGARGSRRPTSPGELPPHPQQHGIPPLSTLPLLVDPQVLTPLPGNDELLLVDLCQPRTWRQAHLPGARHLDPVDILGDDPRLPGLLPDTARLEELLGNIGYRADQHIIIYDDEGGGWAGRFAWLLDSIGHRHWSCLDGGLIAWYRDGLPLVRDIDAVEPTRVSVQVDRQWTASSDELLGELDDPTLAVWDARSAEEYAGLRTGAMRAG